MDKNKDVKLKNILNIYYVNIWSNMLDIKSKLWILTWSSWITMDASKSTERPRRPAVILGAPPVAPKIPTSQGATLGHPKTVCCSWCDMRWNQMITIILVYISIYICIIYINIKCNSIMYILKYIYIFKINIYINI